MSCNTHHSDCRNILIEVGDTEKSDQIETIASVELLCSVFINLNKIVKLIIFLDLWYYVDCGIVMKNIYFSEQFFVFFILSTTLIYWLLGNKHQVILSSLQETVSGKVITLPPLKEYSNKLTRNSLSHLGVSMKILRSYWRSAL